MQYIEHSPLLQCQAAHLGFPPNNVWSLNVTNFVTTTLGTVEDYLSWQTQFVVFLVSPQMMGYVDDTIPSPCQFVFYQYGVQHHNPSHGLWVRLDQCIRTWLLATVSQNTLLEIRDFQHSHQIWARLHQRLNEASLRKVVDLKKTLVKLNKTDNQSMKEYLRLIKVTADSLASINSPVLDIDLVYYTISGLPQSYESFVTTITYMLSLLNFDDLRSKLVFYEHRIQNQQQRDNLVPTHQAYATDRTSQLVAASTRQNQAVQSANSGGSNNGTRNSRGRQNNRNRTGNQNRGNWNNDQNRHNDRGNQNQYNNQQLYNNNHSSLGNSQSASVLGSLPSIICQIYHYPGHGAGNCPERFQSRPNSQVPTFSSFSTGETNDSIWYPDSAAASHMTPSEGQPHGEGPSPGL